MEGMKLPKKLMTREVDDLTTSRVVSTGLETTNPHDSCTLYFLFISVSMYLSTYLSTRVSTFICLCIKTHFPLFPC